MLYFYAQRHFCLTHIVSCKSIGFHCVVIYLFFFNVLSERLLNPSKFCCFVVYEGQESLQGHDYWVIMFV